MIRTLQLHNTGVDEVRAVLVGIDAGKDDFSERMAELALLAESVDPIPSASVVGRRGSVDPYLFIRSGRANELLPVMKERDAEPVIINYAISSTQQRNLERHLGKHVIDRTSLILDIFAQRAKSHLG